MKLILLISFILSLILTRNSEKGLFSLSGLKMVFILTLIITGSFIFAMGILSTGRL